MPSGLFALLDDVATIAKVAAASIDDVGAAASRAGVKAAGVVVDDTAVTPRYVTGFTPDRELPIIWRITKGSIFNKLVLILPALLLLSTRSEEHTSELQSLMRISYAVFCLQKKICNQHLYCLTDVHTITSTTTRTYTSEQR